MLQSPPSSTTGEPTRQQCSWRSRCWTIALVGTVLLVLCTGLAGVTVATDEPVTVGTQTTHTAANATAPDDPESDRLGWEAGYWYNESVSVDRSDGLNDSELDAVVARGMARVEAIRGLEFERSVPVEVISRETYQNRSAGNYEDVPASYRLHENVKWEATLAVGESVDAIAEQQKLYGGTVGGYYSPSEERIVIISENTTAPKMNEITLAQELFHALQDQQFDLSAYDQSTRERHNAIDGIVEGDGNYVDYLYERRCQEEWDCLLPESSGGGGGSSDIPWGIYLTIYQPYSDGPAFVRDVQQSGGWDAVDAVYQDPPASTEQTIHPEKYGNDTPTSVVVEDRSSERWSTPDVGAIDYAEFGEAGLAAMFVTPCYESGTNVVPCRNFYDPLATVDPLNYSTAYTEGWDGDRLVPYATPNSTETNETGYVWKLVWDSERDAAQFVTGYERLLTHYGAAPVVTAADESDVDDARAYVVPEDRRFGDAFAVEQAGDTVVIVNGPTLAALDAVRNGTGPASGSDGGVALQAATDADGDGVYEDVDGDGRVTVLDVQRLFVALDSSVVANNPGQFDVNGDGSVDVVDVQALFVQVG